MEITVNTAYEELKQSIDKLMEINAFFEPDRNLSEADKTFIKRKAGSLFDTLDKAICEGEKKLDHIYFFLNIANITREIDSPYKTKFTQLTQESIQSTQELVEGYLLVMVRTAEIYRTCKYVFNIHMPTYEEHVGTLLRKAKNNDITIHDKLIDDLSKYFPKEISVYQSSK